MLQRAELSDKLDTLTFQTSSDALLLSEEYQNRIIVLRALEYVDRANIIGLKGKVACEISNQEILITEVRSICSFVSSELSLKHAGDCLGRCNQEQAAHFNRNSYQSVQ